MSNLYIIRGIPGSGRSTFSKNMIRCGMADIHVEADMFMVDGDGDYDFNSSMLSYCHNRCKTAVDSALNIGKNVVVSNTFTRKWEMQAYIDMAKAYDCTVTIIICQGNHNNVHGVTYEKVAQMKDRFEY